MCHTFKHFIHIQYFLLLTNLVIVFVHSVSTGAMCGPRQCSLFLDYNPESKLCFCVNLCRPSDPYSILPIQKLLNCQTGQSMTRGGCCSIQPDGEQPKTTLWLWVREMTWYLYARGVRGWTKAKQRWLKVTRELCHEWFHHVRHHVHDGNWTWEFVTDIWRLHCFTVSFRGDVRGESGPRELAQSIGELHNGHVANLHELLYQTGSKKWRDIKFWYMC